MTPATSTMWGYDKAPRRQEELQLQESVAQYLGWALPADAIAHHSPGEGKRTKRAQGELRRSGFTSGWPDLEVCWRRQTVFIELKAKHGALSPAQRATHNRLRYCGFEVAVCRTPEEVEQALRSAGMPLQATVSGWMSERLA